MAGRTGSKNQSLKADTYIIKVIRSISFSLYKTLTYTLCFHRLKLKENRMFVIFFTYDIENESPLHTPI